MARVRMLALCLAAAADDRLRKIADYHVESKHRWPDGTVEAPEGFDWATQPDQTRSFQDLERIPITLQGLRGAVTPGSSEAAMSAFLLATFGASGIYEADDGRRWVARANPSSGNLHPTEAYIIAPLYTHMRTFHYDPLGHAFDVRGRQGTLGADARRTRAALDRGFVIGNGAIVLVLTSICWREEWKYGLRAPRYCYLDVGHAISAVLSAAEAFGWRAYASDHLSDAEVSALAGIDRDDAKVGEADAPAVAIVVNRPMDAEPSPPHKAEGEGPHYAETEWFGRSQALSGSDGGERSWNHALVDALGEAVEKPRTEPSPLAPIGDRAATDVEAFVRLARARRTALAFERDAAPLAAADFFATVQGVVDEAARFEALVGVPAAVSTLLLFVHDVEDVPPGLYVVAAAVADDLKARVRGDWSPAPWRGAFAAYLLSAGDFRKAATEASCNQTIASDGAAFLASTLSDFGHVFLTEPPAPWAYPRLHWQAGALGHRLYLEATRRGAGASGLGCFFDDYVHDLLGLPDSRYQVTYHVAFGARPARNARLLPEDPYATLRGESASYA